MVLNKLQENKNIHLYASWNHLYDILGNIGAMERELD